jgi:hypothetical protein
MQYYTFELDEESQYLCMIITPFGKYKYAWFPTGLKCSSDIAQSIMESVLYGIEYARIHWQNWCILLSVISTSQKFHTLSKIRWIILTYVNSSSKMPNC